MWFSRNRCRSLFNSISDRVDSGSSHRLCHRMFQVPASAVSGCYAISSAITYPSGRELASCQELSLCQALGSKADTVSESMLGRYRLWPELRVPPKAIVIKNFVPRRSPELPAAKPARGRICGRKKGRSAPRCISCVTLPSRERTDQQPLSDAGPRRVASVL